ncbi:MAG: CHAT domain-containing tetratricopeptide repeat protein, partial [Bacteroidota bacterium]
MKHTSTATVLGNLGTLYSAMGKHAMALKLLQQSLIANVPSFNDTSILRNPEIHTSFSKLLLLSTLETKSSVLYNLYLEQKQPFILLKAALSSINQAILLLDGLKGENKLENADLFLEKRYYLAYTSGILYANLLFQRTHDVAFRDLAFLYSEKGKYARLRASMRELEAKKIGGIPEDLQVFEKTLRIDIAFYNKIIQDEKLSLHPDLPNIKQWESVAFQKNKSYDSLITALEKDYPKYYQLKYTNDVKSIRDIQSLLATDEVLLEYSLSETNLFLFTVTRDSVSITTKPIGPSFFSNIDQYRASILNNDQTSKGFLLFCSSANELYKTLIKDVEPLIQRKKMYVIPDGKLGTIPFEALLTNRPGAEAGFRNLPYLVRQNTVCYGYSATIFMNSMMVRNRSLRPGILAFAPSFDKKNMALMTELPVKGEKFVELKGARDEVIAINQQYGGALFLDTAATKKNFLLNSDKYRIIHISTHGIMNDEQPMQSRLVFYQKNDTSNDSYLYAYELFGVKLAADLIVLSACNTATGKLEDGEGVISMSMGGIYSGSPSILSTLWSVNDHSTSVIMQRFYHYLHKGDHKSESIRKAQLDYINGNDNMLAAPFYWAGYILIGNDEPVDFATSLTSSLLTVLLILIVFITLLIIFIKRRRSSSRFVRKLS